MDIKNNFKSILSKANNPETERDFRAACSLYESQCFTSNQPLSQDYQKYINFYHKITSLYLTEAENHITKLIIYDTGAESENFKMLNTPNPLNFGTCIAQLPNGDLFCFGSAPCSGITIIINTDYKLKVLPSGTPCLLSSVIYFDENIYCFGGVDWDGDLTQSRKFDFNENRWINITPLPKANHFCHIAIFNGNILITGWHSRKIMLYSVNIGSFSKIPYDFGMWKRKILINTERLYLIECGGVIYESEVGDEYSWKQISRSIINEEWLNHVYCIYNKGGIYISILDYGYCGYYKLDLKEKVMIKLR